MVAGGDRPHTRWSTTTDHLLFGGAERSAQARWQKTIEAFNEQGESTQLKLFANDAELPDEPSVARVLVKKVRVERTRRFGDGYLGLELWKHLGLQEFFARHLDQEIADVPWSRVAALLAINRLCAPGSELAIERHWYPSTALDDLLQIEAGKINDTRLYRCLDRLLPCKDQAGAASEATLRRVIPGRV